MESVLQITKNMCALFPVLWGNILSFCTFEETLSLKDVCKDTHEAFHNHLLIPTVCYTQQLKYDHRIWRQVRELELHTYFRNLPRSWKQSVKKLTIWAWVKPKRPLLAEENETHFFENIRHLVLIGGFSLSYLPTICYSKVHTLHLHNSSLTLTVLLDILSKTANLQHLRLTEDWIKNAGIAEVVLDNPNYNFPFNLNCLEFTESALSVDHSSIIKTIIEQSNNLYLNICVPARKKIKNLLHKTIIQNIVRLNIDFCEYVPLFLSRRCLNKIKVPLKLSVKFRHLHDIFQWCLNDPVCHLFQHVTEFSILFFETKVIDFEYVKKCAGGCKYFARLLDSCENLQVNLSIEFATQTCEGVSGSFALINQSFVNLIQICEIINKCLTRKSTLFHTVTLKWCFHHEKHLYVWTDHQESQQHQILLKQHLKKLQTFTEKTITMYLPNFILKWQNLFVTSTHI